VDATTWRITLAARPGTEVDYKLALNPAARGAGPPGWGGVERSAACADVPNRRLVTPAAGNLDVAVTVAAWAGVGGC
jgi:hypothetical protein